MTRRNDVYSGPRRPRHQRRHGRVGSWVCARRAAEPVAVLTRGLADARWRPGIGRRWTRFPFARLRCIRASGTRTWCWRGHRLRLHRYDRVRPSPDIGGLLGEIGHDPIAIFREARPSRLGSQRPLAAGPRMPGQSVTCWRPLGPTGGLINAREFFLIILSSCRAPLRNRTVDLLLTMDSQSCAGQHRPGTIKYSTCYLWS